MTVPKRFGVLRFFGTLLKVFAWLVLIGTILGAIAVGVLGTMGGSFIPAEVTGAIPGATAGVAGGILGAIVLLFVGLLYFLALYVAGETIHMQLAIEENTRLTAALLLRMHQEQGESAPAPAYGSGFSTEGYAR